MRGYKETNTGLSCSGSDKKSSIDECPFVKPNVSWNQIAYPFMIPSIGDAKYLARQDPLPEDEFY